MPERPRRKVSPPGTGRRGPATGGQLPAPVEVEQGGGGCPDALADATAQVVDGLGQTADVFHLVAGEVGEQPRLGGQPGPDVVAGLSALPVGRLGPGGVEFVDS